MGIYLKDLPDGAHLITIVYVEARDSFIGKLEDGTLISFGFKALTIPCVGDHVRVLQKTGSQMLVQGTRIYRLNKPRASP